HAEPNYAKVGCEGAGYAWDDTLGCANKPCHDGLFGDGLPGATSGPLSSGETAVCDGFTGEWVVLIRSSHVSPSGLLAPHMSGTALSTGTTPVVPRTLRPLTTSR